MIASGKLPEALDEFFADDAALQEDTAKLRGHAVAMAMSFSERRFEMVGGAGARGYVWFLEGDARASWGIVRRGTQRSEAKGVLHGTCICPCRRVRRRSRG